MRRATEKLSPVSKNTIVPLLEKARGELPAVAPPPQKAAKAAPPSKGKPTREASNDALKNGGKSGGGNAVKVEKSAGKSRLGLSKPSATKKGAEDVDSSPLYQVHNSDLPIYMTFMFILLTNIELKSDLVPLCNYDIEIFIPRLKLFLSKYLNERISNLLNNIIDY